MTMLTDAEHSAMTMTIQLWEKIKNEIVGVGPSRDGDLLELAQRVHAIQQMILSQAAARAYPSRYRLLGD